jgi:DNA/RNA endonuclease YhcR with UshA esterase domain
VTLLGRLIVFWAVVGSPASLAAAELTTQQAASHVGETATVCGTVASANYAVRTSRQPTFLNLDQAYPQQLFTILIWGTDRAKFGSPEVGLMGKRVCATGLIESYKGKPEIVATDPRQLSVR